MVMDTLSSTIVRKNTILRKSTEVIFPMEKILNKTNEIARDPIKVIYNIFKARQSQINE